MSELKLSKRMRTQTPTLDAKNWPRFTNTAMDYADEVAALEAKLETMKSVRCPTCATCFDAEWALEIETANNDPQ